MSNARVNAAVAKESRARAITWLFSALNTVEPPILDREAAVLMARDKPWYADRLPILEDRVHARLRDLSTRLGNAHWLDGAFSAGDLMMVLRRLGSSKLMDRYSNLSAYVAAAKRDRRTSAHSPIS